MSKFFLKNICLFERRRIIFAAAKRGNSSAGRARPCQGRGREFESRFPLHKKSPVSEDWAFLFLCIGRQNNEPPNIHGWLISILIGSRFIKHTHGYKIGNGMAWNTSRSEFGRPLVSACFNLYAGAKVSHLTLFLLKKKSCAGQGRALKIPQNQLPCRNYAL